MGQSESVWWRFLLTHLQPLNPPPGNSLRSFQVVQDYAAPLGQFCIGANNLPSPARIHQDSIDVNTLGPVTNSDYHTIVAEHNVRV